MRARYFASKNFRDGTIPNKVCPICESDKYAEDFIGDDTNWARCMVCGSGFKMLMPTEEEEADFYKHEYRMNNPNPGGPYPNVHNFRTQLIRSWRQFMLVADLLIDIRSGLDIGCALGWNVNTMKFLGYEHYGVEPGEIDRQFARETLGLDLYASLEDLPDISVDLVIMSHVLEHINDPVIYLTHIREKYMSDQGRILVEVPSQLAPSAWSSYHIIAFSPKGIANTFERAGFEVEKIIAEGASKVYDRGLIWAVGKVKDGCG